MLLTRRFYKMINKDIIKQVIRQFQNWELPEVIPREVDLPLESGKIVTLVGSRRSGKSYLMYDAIRKLTSKSLDINDILYLNFEDERLSFNVDELDLIIQAWRELHNGVYSPNHYFFFDEIQNITGWEKFIRRLYDIETKNIFITGSNSAFLATDIATSLRGRTLVVEVFPFDFREYLRYKKIEKDYYDPGNRALIINEMKAFIQQGSFPEVIGKDLFQQSEILRIYYYLMLYKDLIERYKISSISVVKHFIEKLADNITKGFSVNKIYNQLRSLGLVMDKNLPYDLLNYIENIYLAFKIQRFDYSLSSRNRSDKKIYFIDNGLVGIIVHQFGQNSGKLLENAAFIFLRRKFGSLLEGNIFYYKGKMECDFIIFNQRKATHCIQVSYDISDIETRKRELNGLIEAMDYFKLEKGYILTSEQEEEIRIDSKVIYVRPAFKVFIDNEL